MIPSYIKDYKGKQLVLFDMDGVLAEYAFGENTDIANEVPNVYLNKRPVQSMINVAKELCQMQDVSVGILSSCNFQSQMIEKKKWLKKYMPFLQDDLVYIIIWADEDYTKETRCFAKLNEIKKIKGYDKIYLIDDKHSILNATNEALPGCAHHVSEFID